MMKYISKSSYMAGLDCHRKLWQLLWDRDSAGKRSGIDQLRMDFGILFGEVAHCLYPNAVLIDIDKRKLKRAEEDTRKAIEKGFQVSIHAIGDAGNRAALDAFVDADACGPSRLRHRIEHSQVVAANDIPRFKAL